MVIPFEVHQAWLSEYFVRRSRYLLRFNPPPPQAISAGAEMLVTLGRADDVD